MATRTGSNACPALCFTRFTSKEIADNERRFQLYISANELDGKPEATKVAHLRLSLEDKVNDLIDSFNLEQVTVRSIFEKLKQELTPKANVSHEKYKFFGRSQQEGESFNDFYIDLLNISKHCEFGDQQESNLKARIVYGVKCTALQERLMRNPDLSLKDVVNYCRSTEDAKNKSEEINGHHNHNEIQQLSSKFKPKLGRKIHHGSNFHRESNFQKGSNFQKPIEQQPYHCKKCSTVHSRAQCPAFGKTCRKCNGLHHFASVCRRKNFPRRNVHALEENSDDCFRIVDAISVDTLSKQQWYQTFEFNGTKVSFKLDTGADVSVLPVSVLNSIDPHWSSRIKKNNTVCEAFGGFPLKIIGAIKLKFVSKTASCQVEVLVMPDSKGIIPILGREACENLGLVHRVLRVNSTVDGVNTSGTCDSGESNTKAMFPLERYEKVFVGLGKFPQKYKIRTNDKVMPTVKPPRRVAFALLEKLKLTLKNMTEKEVIEPVDQPKSWCSNLVIIEKKSGDLRLCLDPADLNQCVEREYYQIPTLEEIKTQLSGKKWFSVLDLREGFHQISLDDDSKDLCCFSTPFGYHRFLRLPFGLNSAPEVFMKFNVECFKGIKNLIIYFDDFLIATEDLDSHKKTLHEVFQRALELNIKFNKEKMQLMKTEFKYLGHIFSEKGCQLDKDRVEAVKNLKVPKNVKELQSLLGMYNYMREFIPKIADLTAPLRVLLKKNVEWHWTNAQQKAFENLKEIVSNPPVLKNFDPNQDVIIQTDTLRKICPWNKVDLTLIQRNLTFLLHLGLPPLLPKDSKT
ncbi:uncharacterized protein K02A2.6-like [Diaphorina citri]|uniref:Uncharacterized protein K02A2.6-like n=1 Tax=Diaphorina citri TaxID=121845 RepID=A0A3Q0JEA7_DIACI|nr:uncharacterized protein K02A2.6-like [Diaphorina citri]